MRPKTRLPIHRYGSAVAAVALATGARWLLDPVLGDHHPFATFFLAVLFTAWYAGLGPSLLALALGAVAAANFFSPPRDPFALLTGEHQVGLALYLCVGLAGAAFSEALQAARRRAEAAAAEATRHREWLRILLAGVDDAVLATDTRGDVTFLNPAAEALTGWTQAEAAGRELADLLDLRDDETGAAVADPVARVLGGGTEDEPGGPRRLVRRDGSTRLVEESVSALRDEHRRPVGGVVVLRDVTEKRQAEQALRRRADELAESLALLDTLLKTSPVGLAFLDRDGRYVRINEALAALNGLPVEAHLGRTRGELLPDLAPALEPIFRRVLETGEPSVGQEISGETPATPGRRRHWLASHYPVRTPEGHVLGVGAVVVDITEQKRAEGALREADRRKDEFLATLAHELRNPLATVRTALHVLQQPGLSGADAATARQMMGRQVEQLVQLVDDLLDVARVVHDRIALRRQRVALAAVLARAVETARPAIDAARHALTVTVPPGPVWLEADEVRLVQVVGNLLHNAAKYTEPGGRIDLTAAREGDEAVVRVRDTGIGIRPDMLGRVFDLFVQSERATDRAQGGLGIGLTLVRKLVELHGGRVHASSEGPGTGSEFVVRLPALPASVTAKPRTNGAPGAGAVMRRRVLLVDDNVDAAESLALLLRLQGHDVRVAHDGPAALRAVAAERPEVVFLDIGMPGMDGYEVCRRLRQLRGVDGVRVVALTGWGQDEDRRRSREAGFDLHLVKPVEPEALHEVLAGLEQVAGAGS
jgi:PAS domain S-box-containing protein